MNKIVGAAVLMIVGYVLISYFFAEDAEVIESVDTLRVLVAAKETVYAEPDSMRATEDDTIATYRWQPEHENLKGHVDIEYGIGSRKFGIFSDLEIERVEILRRIQKPPEPFRFGVGLAYFFDDVVMLSGEIEIRERVGLELMGRSDQTVGLKLNWRF